MNGRERTIAVPQRPKLSVREKQLLVAIDEAVGALKALDEVLTNVPPRHLTLEHLKVWEQARTVTENVRSLHASVINMAGRRREL